MIHRKGVTLTEVLISIFVMALGLLGLLALFPVGALTMAQAVKDDRTAHLAYTADAIARFQNLRVDPQVVQQAVAGPPVYNYYGGDPGGKLTPLDPLVTAGTYAGPSYPVFVDPIGFQAFSLSPAWQNWVGGMDGTVLPTGIPRRSVSFAPQQPAPAPLAANQILRWFTLLDDIDFGDNGLPPNPVFQRQGEFSWACLCRMTQYIPPAAAPLPPYPPNGPPSGINISIVVYYKRSLNLTSGLTPSGETAYTAIATPNTTRSITLSWNPAAGQDKPAVRKSTWILDATMGNPAANQKPHGYFYRAVNVIDPGTLGVNSIDVETQTDLQDPGTLQTIVVMESVAEVFEKGP